jgi:hypothetical protein
LEVNVLRVLYGKMDFTRIWNWRKIQLFEILE